MKIPGRRPSDRRDGALYAGPMTTGGDGGAGTSEPVVLEPVPPRILDGTWRREVEGLRPAVGRRRAGPDLPAPNPPPGHGVGARGRRRGPRGARARPSRAAVHQRGRLRRAGDRRRLRPDRRRRPPARAGPRVGRTRVLPGLVPAGRDAVAGRGCGRAVARRPAVDLARPQHPIPRTAPARARVCTLGADIRRRGGRAGRHVARLGSCVPRPRRRAGTVVAPRRRDPSPGPCRALLPQRRRVPTGRRRPGLWTADAPHPAPTAARGRAASPVRARGRSRAGSRR